MDYQSELRSTPAPGRNGCHPHLLRVANLGARQGLAPEQVAADLRAAIPPGTRRVSDREIRVTVDKAFRDKADVRGMDHWKPYTPTQRPRLDAKALLSKIMAEGSPDEVDLWESSPYRLDGSPEDDTPLLLRHFYNPDDYLFLGDTYDTGVVTVANWLERIKSSGTTGLPHIIPNPMTGLFHETSSGASSRRCDAAVAQFRFAIVEFDDMSREDQLCFWSGIINRNLLPVACLIDSGGKSLHAWLRVNISDREAWDQQIKQRLFNQWLIPLGVDSTTKNPARLSRLAGHFRKSTGRWQRLLWLQQKGS